MNCLDTSTMPLKMRFERSERRGKIAFFRRLKCRQQRVRNFCHRRNDDDRMSFDLRRNNVKNALKGGHVADRRAAKFHYCRVQVFAHNKNVKLKQIGCYTQ